MEANIIAKKKKMKNAVVKTDKTLNKPPHQQESQNTNKRKRVPKNTFSPSPFQKSKKILLRKKAKKDSKVNKKKIASKVSPLTQKNQNTMDTELVTSDSNESSSVASSDEETSKHHRKKNLKSLKQLQQIKTEKASEYEHSSQEYKQVDQPVVNVTDDSNDSACDENITDQQQSVENIIESEEEQKSSNENERSAITSAVTLTTKKEDVKENINSEDQLYGKDWPDEKMIPLGESEIYCRERVYESAISTSKEVTHLARRLLEGVIKMDIFPRCTLTGQPPRSQGKKQTTDVYCINVKAKKAIIDFAIAEGEKNNWVIPHAEKINRSLTQKIGEIKATLSKNE